jgi:hypothetical protein
MHLLNIGLLGIGWNLGLKISHILLGIIEIWEVPSGADFIFFCEHPISSFWPEIGLKSRKIKLFRTILLHYIQCAAVRDARSAENDASEELSRARNATRKDKQDRK